MGFHAKAKHSNLDTIHDIKCNIQNLRKTQMPRKMSENTYQETSRIYLRFYKFQTWHHSAHQQDPLGEWQCIHQ